VPTVLVADDSRPVRDAIATLLQNHPDISVVFFETLCPVSELRPDLVLVDVHMKDENFVALSDFKSRFNGTT
jgi:DNA-binding NarL/FixJ family response regulator